MSDVGLGATLQLDIADALARIDSLSAQITEATSNVPVTLDEPDASPVTTAIDQAVAASDTSVTPEADSSGVTASIDQAVESADGTVPIDADTAPAQDALAGLASDAQAADVTIPVTADTANAEAAVLDIGAGASIDIPVELDITDAEQQASDLSDTISTLGSSASGATSDVESLSSGTSALSNIAQIGAGNLSGLSGLVGGFGSEAAVAVGGVVGLAGVIGGLADSGIRAIESQKRFNDVFGSFADAITHVNVGSLNGDLATLATNLGSSTGELRNADTLIGQFGISSGRTQEQAAKVAEQIDAIALRTRAMNPELGSAGKIADGLTGALARGGRAAGNYGISLTSAEIQAHALALGLADSDGNIDQFAKLMAGADLAAHQLGDTLGTDVAAGADNLSIRLDKLKVQFSATASDLGKPIADPVVDLLEHLAPLGLDVEKILGGVAQSLIPVVEILSAFAAVVEPVAHELGELNPDLIGLAAGGVAAAAGLGEIVTVLTTDLAAANPVLAGFLAAIGLTVAAVSAFNVLTNKNAQKQFAADVKSATSALEDENGILRVTSDAIANYIDTSSRFSTRHQTDDIQRLGETSTQVADQIQEGAQGFDQFVDAAGRAGEISRVFEDHLGHLTDAAGHYLSASTQVTEINGRLFTGNTDLIKSFEHEQQVLEATAASGIKKAQADGSITAAQAKAALASDDQITAYNGLRTQIDIHAQQIADLTKKYQPFLDATLAVGGALGQVSAFAPKLASDISGLGDHTGSASLELINFATDADKAKLSADQLSVTAAALGTTSDKLSGFIDGVSKSLDDFESAAVGSLPTVGDAFKKMGDDIAGTKLDESKILSPSEFIANLKQETAGMAEFLADLKQLTDAGFGTLAGTIAEQGPAIGGSLASSLVTALDQGNSTLVANANKALADFNNQWQFNVTYLQTVLGPQFILQSGLVASLASTAFGDNLDFTQATTLATGLAALDLDTGGKAVVAIAFAQGTEAATQYGIGVAGMSPVTVRAALDAGKALISEGPGAGKNSPAAQAGKQTADSYADGLIAGLKGRLHEIGNTVAGLIQQEMLAQGQKTLKTGSPSKAARDLLGIPFVEGIIEGVTSGAGDTRAAVSSVLDDALARAQRDVVAGAEALTVAAAVGSPALAAAPSGQTVTIGSINIPVTVAAGASEAEARAAGAAAVDGAATQLDRRFGVDIMLGNTKATVP